MIDTLLNNLNPTEISVLVVGWLPKVLSAAALLLLFLLLARVARRAAYAALGRTEMPDGTRVIISRFVRYIVITFGALTVLDQAGVNVTSMVAGLGIAGLAVSFAAQDTIANVISGVTLLLDKPFKQGDWIEIGDVNATVTEIRLRTTVLTTFDNETIVIPNRTLAAERIINYTLTPRARVKVSVGIAYKENIDAAREILLGLLQGDERVQADPAPAVLVTGLGASSVDLQLRFWTEDPSKKFPLFWEYTEKAKKALDAADIEIPFPHMQLFVEPSEGIRQLKGSAGQA